MKICADCKHPQPNVGPWRDEQGSREICGPCKMAIWSRGEGPEKLKNEIETVLRSEQPGAD